MFPQSIRYCCLLAGLVFATTTARAGNPVEASSRIDEIIQRDLQKHLQEPNPLVSDVEFVRRVYLDLIGRIPTVEELTEFLDAPGPNRREIGRAHV